MLTGLLHPTSGTVRVAGYRPQERARDFLRRVTLVMGQKQQLLWDLPPTETFELNRALFDIPRPAYRETLDELVELLELSSFIDQPSRNLSLGQRMRCELAASLLHRPSVLFLDEPTIGLDVEVQALVRRFIGTYNARHGATVVLTSHDMDDVAALVDRVILIDKGILRFDGTLDALSRRFGDGRRLVVRGPGEVLQPLGFEATADRRWQATVHADEVNRLLAAVLQQLPSANISVSDPPLEDVLRKAFGAHRQDDAEASP
jgi:ABC-2 type transport system ATP-binding protein